MKIMYLTLFKNSIHQIISSMWKVRCSIPSRYRYRPKSFKQVIADPLPNAWQQAYVTRVLRYDHRNRCPLCRSRFGVLKDPHFWIAVGAKRRSNFAVFFLKFRHLHIDEKFFWVGRKNQRYNDWKWFLQMHLRVHLLM